MTAARMLCLWCPDWPVVAARAVDPALAGLAVAVVAQGSVASASAEARHEGVRRGQRRREAEARCPGLVVVAVGAEAKVFEVVARAVEVLAPRLVLDRPGLLFVPTRGPSRYYGGDEALAARVATEAAAAGASDARVGVADGTFAAHLAARSARPGAPVVVGRGKSRDWLAPFPVRVLEPWGTGLLVHLGLPTLGNFAALPTADVTARFGAAGVAAQRLARGEEVRPAAARAAAPELEVAYEFDPPAHQVETAVFAARMLSDQLAAALARDGLACARVRVEAETDHGERLARCWRAGEGALGAPAVLAERIRWQLEAWVTGASASEPGGDGVRGRSPRGGGGASASEPGGDGVRGRSPRYASGVSEMGPTGGLLLLRLIPEEVVPAGRAQPGLWGGDRAAADRAARAALRVQGLLGAEAVAVAVPRGGRTPDERVAWVPFGQDPGLCRVSPTHIVGEARQSILASWPGAVPGPAPARVFSPGRPAALLDGTGHPVRVSGRGEPSAAPARLSARELPGGGGAVEAWAGPWLHDLRWWDARAHRRRALWQVIAAGTACLVATEGATAHLEALYD